MLSHWCAAAIHGLPLIGEWPSQVHVTVSPLSGARSRGGIVKHSMVLGNDDDVEVAGLLVISVPRTVVDVAATTGFMNGVVVVDQALHQDRFGRIAPLIFVGETDFHWPSFELVGGRMGTASIVTTPTAPGAPSNR